MNRLSGKVALITGGNTGIGRAVAIAYAREGADIAIGWFSHESDAAGLLQDVQAMGRRAVAIRCDVTEEAQVIALFGQAIGQLGRIDVLVNNAGIQLARPIIEMSVADFDGVLAVHLRGAFLCAREAARHMIPRRSGRIINVCSQLGWLGRENYTAYSTAKSGMVGFTRALARELAPHGVLVNGMAPGLLDTGFDPLPEDRKRSIAASLPMQRLGTLDEATPGFVFLASDESSYFCGQVLNANGGQVMR